VKSLVLGAAIISAAVMAATPNADGAPNPRRVPSAAKIVHLRAQLRALQARVHRLTAERDRARALLARARARHVSPLTVAVDDVRREVEWAGGASSPLSGQYVAEAAMDYVIGHVRTGLYGYLENVGAPLPPYLEPVNDILATQTGICGQAERTFAAIVKALGFQVHDIGFEFVDPNGAPDAHSAAEVFYDGGWHFFDPTFGQFWTDDAGNVLSIADIRSGLGTRQKDNAAFVNLIENASWGGDYTWFETDPSTVVITVQQPR
jgi:outer membrane murein-binding lipoprotein Lpp